MAEVNERPAWETQRPKDRMFLFAVDRIAALEDFARRNCRVPNCGTRGSDGEIVTCAGVDCGEKRIEEWHRRELQCMRDLYNLIEWMERAEIAKAAAAAKAEALKGRKS